MSVVIYESAGSSVSSDVLIGSPISPTLVPPPHWPDWFDDGRSPWTRAAAVEAGQGPVCLELVCVPTSHLGVSSSTSVLLPTLGVLQQLYHAPHSPLLLLLLPVSSLPITPSSLFPVSARQSAR